MLICGGGAHGVQLLNSAIRLLNQWQGRKFKKCTPCDGGMGYKSVLGFKHLDANNKKND